MNPDIYFEDLSVGDTFETGPVTVTEQMIVDFAREYDPQPMHTDREAAAVGPFKGLIASGWHTAALVMKLTAEAKPWGNTPMLGLGVASIKWPQPVRPGDTIQAKIEVEAFRRSKSQPAFGVVDLKASATNQRGEIVYEKHPSCWIPLRKPD